LKDDDDDVWGGTRLNHPQIFR